MKCLPSRHNFVLNNKNWCLLHAPNAFDIYFYPSKLNPITLMIYTLMIPNLVIS